MSLKKNNVSLVHELERKKIVFRFSSFWLKELSTFSVGNALFLLLAFKFLLLNNSVCSSKGFADKTLF